MARLYQYVNPNLFAANAIGTFGNAGHNSLRGPGYFDVDLALSREFKLRERLTLHARAEAFNVLNHPELRIAGRQSFRPATSGKSPRPAIRVSCRRPSN